MTAKFQAASESENLACALAWPMLFVAGKTTAARSAQKVFFKS